MKKISVFFLILIVFSIENYSQKTKNLTQLSGKINDESGNPISVDVNFTNSKGEKKTSKSNSKDGAYSLVLTPDSYDVTVRNYIITDFPSIVLPNTGGYNEVSYNFSAKKLSVGMEIKKFNPFQSNSELFNQEQFDDIIAFMQSNKTTFVEFCINANDCIFKPIKKKIKVEGKKKPTTKEITISNDEQAKEIIEKRKSELSKFLLNKSIPERTFSFLLDAKYHTDSSPAKTEKKSKKQKDKIQPVKTPINTVIAKISKVGL